MVDFSTCPRCAALSAECIDTAQQGYYCSCNGTNIRPSTHENIQLALSANDWLAELVNDTFIKYASINRIAWRDGCVSKFEFCGDIVTVAQWLGGDCYDYHHLPIRYFTENGLYEIEKDYEAKVAAETRKKRADELATQKKKKNRKNALEAQIAKLQEELKTL